MYPKKIAILQSNYIPWKGYFDLIANVDEFVLYDDVQYTKNDWRNRNIIISSEGPRWLTIPVGIDLKRKINEVKISDSWNLNHWKIISDNYKSAPHFLEIALWLKPLYLDRKYENLSELNRAFIEAICKYLNITTKISNSWDYKARGARSERLVNICLETKSTQYISGPSAQNYIDKDLFLKNQIELKWFSYDNYPTYSQIQSKKFIHEVSIIDLLFNCGNTSLSYLMNVKNFK